MAYALRDINLLELRKSEREQLAASLEGASQTDLENFARNIENTLSRFSAIFPENEEQVFLFGLEMNHLLNSLNLARSIPGGLRDHLNEDVAIVFAGGFMGLSLKETREKLEADRKRRREITKGEVAARQARQKESETSLIKEIEDLVADKAASLLPPEIIVRR
jgi:hypothetical protein